MDNQIPVPGGQIPPEQPSGTPSQQTPIKPSSNKGLIIGLVIAIIVALAAVIYLLTAKEAVSPSNGQAGNQNQVMDSRESILSVLQSDWAEFSNSFTVKPVLGATTWGYTGVQFISDDTFFIRFEDGHVGHLAIVQYQDNSLKLLELLESKLTLNRQEYEELLEQYGVPNYEVSNYTISIFRNGKIISFNTLTLAPENIILGENTESSWKTYRNEGYGFEMQLTDAWEGYKVEIEEMSSNFGGGTSIFLVPHTDNLYDKTWPGFAAIIKLSVFNREYWQKILQEQGPKPKYIAESNGFVFAYSQWQDPPIDLLSKDFELDKVISTFKFINN